MKPLPVILILFSFMPIAFAASDCEHSCCSTFNGSWNEDFDDCKRAATGFDGCVSDCEAAVWAARPQGPGPADPEHTYSCKVGLILLSILGGAVFLKCKT
ncbi:hypothetical protein L0Y65_06045 [Candidatus Micrarchaeota archaeon]|nr:hypothetical protein [Candidatus Micrarchaeota archaeon]